MRVSRRSRRRGRWCLSRRSRGKGGTFLGEGGTGRDAFQIDSITNHVSNKQRAISISASVLSPLSRKRRSKSASQNGNERTALQNCDKGEARE